MPRLVRRYVVILIFYSFQSLININEHRSINNSYTYDDHHEVS
jgi:hypothetical protein